MAEPAGRIAARLRLAGRVLAVVSLLLGAAFVVLARRSAGVADGMVSALFWGAAGLQFVLAFVLLRAGRPA